MAPVSLQPQLAVTAQPALCLTTALLKLWMLSGLSVAPEGTEEGRGRSRLGRNRSEQKVTAA